MSVPQTLSIDGVDYVRKDSIQETDGEIKIAVLDRGFVYVGKTEFDGDFLIISGAKNIRVWGTTKGLGELVNGPTNSTKLDNVGTIRIPVRALISVIDVVQEKWNCI